MGRRFVTARDIDDLLAAGGSRLEVDADTVLTDLAREYARDRGVEVVRGASGGAGAPAPVAAGAAARSADPDNGPAPGPAPAAVAEGPTRRQLRAAVRAAVVEEFGGVPDGLDPAIGRVLDRFGVGE